MESNNRNGERIKEILEEYRPSQLDELLVTICPFYQNNNELTSAYGLIHDFANSRVLEKLQLRLNEIAIASEVPLEFGRVDGSASKLALKSGSEPMVFIEIKTGKVKLIQPAIYTYFEGIKTLVVELKVGKVLPIDSKTAERLLDELVEHVDDRKKLKEAGKKIPGKECRYCCNDCEHRISQTSNHNPLKSLSKVLDNVDIVVEKILAEVNREVGEEESC